MTSLLVCCLEKYWEMSSLGETTTKKLITTYPEEFVNHNKTFLTRVYPSGKRVDSSNYNPVDMWNHGCQMGKDVWWCVVVLYSVVWCDDVV